MREFIAPRPRKIESNTEYKYQREFRALCVWVTVLFTLTVLAGILGAWIGVCRNDTPIGADAACREYAELRGVTK
jgi:hypothetical protein